ncbi:DUF192 domain-containing protein [Limibaculum sp. FT325]|uniref:DUF192 domain-containing protein n=1 Tax=Thermohalobaculum sediminis TaxID=2939436 RepID=UPI0020BDBBD2|nr:DUF192 domain-containing protein [Limibaculum sediminis]MCL5777865.1 DUF192 domain-containing protein [Limibaculum sediminis]
MSRAGRDGFPILRPALLAGLVVFGLGAPATGSEVCAPDRVSVLAPAGPVRYRVEIADDPDEQAQGLMFRTSMDQDAGMLFIFPEPRQATFWMKNTILPLDIVFIDATGLILNIAERTTPFSEATLPSQGQALAVLEVNAGEAARHGFGPGSQVVHPAFAAAPPEHRCPR